MRGKSRDEVSLLDVLVDGFEKNEVMDGWHWRDLPMPEEDSARRKVLRSSTRQPAGRALPRERRWTRDDS